MPIYKERNNSAGNNSGKNNPEAIMDNQSTETVPTSSKSSTVPRHKSGKIVTTMTLCFSLVAIAGGYYIWQQLQITQRQAQQQIVQLQKDLAQANHLLTQQSDTLKAVQHESQQLMQQSAKKQTDSFLVEANYLVKLAAFHLTFENNVVLARQLLEAADQRAAANQNPTLWPLRQTFAKDIAMLKATATVDVPGVVAQLGALSQTAEGLPATPITPSEQKADSAVTAPTSTQILPYNTLTDKFKKLLSAAGRALSDMVIISKDSKLLPTLLTTEQRLYVVTNIQSQLTLAQWAVVHRQPAVYQQSLLAVTHWLQRHFSENNPLVKSMLNTLTDLQKISVNPATPTISHSIDMLQKMATNQ